MKIMLMNIIFSVKKSKFMHFGTYNVSTDNMLSMSMIHVNSQYLRDNIEGSCSQLARGQP